MVLLVDNSDNAKLSQNCRTKSNLDITVIISCIEISKGLT